MGKNAFLFFLFLLIHTAASKYIVIDLLKSYLNISSLTNSICYVPGPMPTNFGITREQTTCMLTPAVEVLES